MNHTTVHACIEVSPLSRMQIRRAATDLRRRLVWQDPWFPIVEFAELVLPGMLDGDSFEVQTMDEMGNDHGRTFPDRRELIIREDVYLSAVEGRGRDRMTVAHEVGHLLLHSGVPFARSVARQAVPPYRSSEWQASCFGAEFLMPISDLRRCSSVLDAAETFGVSDAAAAYQWRFR